ncbi:MAG TPA: copper-binding protein [Thermoanaerobaculia bacterium]|nr:copper-binding protein [Thermoanaerobaculia bacterium]
MRRATLLLITLVVFACGEKEDPKPLSEPGEKLYTVRGVILGRRASDNTLNVDHEAIPDFMTAMVMDYQVRGADVASLPADKTRIEAKLHVTDRAYWITDVKPIP